MMELKWGSNERVGLRMRLGLRARGEGEIVVSSVVSEMRPVLLRVDIDTNK